MFIITKKWKLGTDICLIALREDLQSLEKMSEEYIENLANEINNSSFKEK